jgi:hypothetical protein
MVGKVNAQVRNNETGKSSIIHLDRIKELKENLEEDEETEGMQQHQQQDRRVSHHKEDEVKQHEEVRVSRRPAGAAAAVLAQDRDLRDQVEAEQGQKRQVKQKKQKQIEMQAGWLPRVDHTGKKGPRTRSMGLQIDYLDDHRTDLAEERLRQIWAEESRREEEEHRDRQDYIHMRRQAGPTEAEQEAEQEVDWSFESLTSGPAWQGWQPDSGQEGPEADFFTAEAGHLSDILGAHAEGLTRLEPIDKAEEEKQLADLGIQADPGEVRQVPQLQSTRRRGRSGGRPTDPGALDHFSLPTLAQEYKQRKKKVQSGTGKSFP